ncbi:type II toxin-antitoxin system RelE/ParE family toxin [Elusimicrobiota bacterium]
MILDFADKTTEDIFHGENTKEARKVPKEVWRTAQRKLDMLNAAHALKDLASPPGNKLEPLKDKLKGFHSIRINDKYRAIFQFSDGNVSRVKVTDYH